MLFSCLASVFEKINQTNSRLLMTQYLAQLLENATEVEAEYIAYLTLGLLNPPYKGTQFNVAQKNIIKIIAQLSDQDGTIVQEKFEELGDLGLVVEYFYKDTCSDLTIQQVYKKLKEIEAIEGTGSQEVKNKMIETLLLDLDSSSAKYCIKIILGTLRLGFSDMTFIDALSWMSVGNKSYRKSIESAYNSCADLGLIAKTIKSGGIEAIKKMTINVGIPIRPAAADRLPTIQAIIDKLGECIAQPKLDGFRLQIHIDNTGVKPIIKFFSRNLIDMSGMFPELVQACKKLPVKNFIADGEAMVFDQNTQQFASFQETVKRRRKHAIEQAVLDFPLRLYLFDLLYFDNNSYLNVTHNKRRQALESIVNPLCDSTVTVIEERSIKTAQDLTEYFNHVIAEGLEGLVVKKNDAPYQPGKRSSNWIKLKYQAAQKLEDTIDAVILGYYHGQGKRADFKIGAFLVGIYNHELEVYQTVAKVGTGLTDMQWIELKKRCDSLKTDHQPKNVVCDKNLAPHVWVHPEQVCEVLADEVTLSPIHTAGKTAETLGYALRFPRFIKYRDDKSSLQATTLSELKTFYKK